MAKGIYTASACILLREPVGLTEVESVLGEFEIRQRSEEAVTSWEFCGPSLVIPYRPEVNGAAIVDILDRPWPDAMGDPQAEPMLFGAWSMGQFGPFTFPHGLARAGQQSWTWQEGRTIPQQHQAFLRIRTTYVLGGESETPVLPKDYDALPEMLLVARIAGALMELPQTLCYFNPNGEVVRDRDGFYHSLEQAQQRQLLPLDLWSNIRLFRLEQDSWLLMDTVGNAQLEQPDFEVWFADQAYECGSMDPFLRNLTWHLIQRGEVINDGDTVDGPGHVRWRARHFEDSRILPPRRVIALTPEDGSTPPAGYELRGKETPKASE